jgi:dephospho-CoA kinase
MTLFGLTGGIAMGKSTAAELLQQDGVAVVDTDDLARQVVQPGQPALEEIRLAFGSDLIGDDGHLQREAMARLVFADTAARRQLEAILHPRIRALWLEETGRWRAQGCRLGVVVIPLLFETGAAGQFDATVCVACTEATQRERLAARGWTLAQSAQRLQAQWPAERKMALADFVVWTEGTLDVHREQLRRTMRVGSAGDRGSAAVG